MKLTKFHGVSGLQVGSVSDLGEPILVLSDGHAFVHSKKLGSWLRIADDHAPNSEFYQLLPPPGDDSLLSKLQVRSPLSLVQMKATDPFVLSKPTILNPFLCTTK